MCYYFWMVQGIKHPPPPLNNALHKIILKNSQLLIKQAGQILCPIEPLNYIATFKNTQRGSIHYVHVCVQSIIIVRAEGLKLSLCIIPNTDKDPFGTET